MSHTNSNTISRSTIMLATAIVAVAAIAGGAIGAFVAVGNSSPTVNLEPLKLHASSAASGKTMSLATGFIDESVEGVYILDHLTGNLQCWVLNPKTGKISGIYTANVNVGLQTDRAGEKDYVMTTGVFVFSGGTSGQKVPARSVVYVAEGTSGNVAAYGLTYDKSALRRGGGVENGTLELIGQGPARAAGTTRDQ